MFAQQSSNHSELVYVRGTVVENKHQADMLSSCLRVKTLYNTFITVRYNTEFPPAINTHAGDVGFGLRMGDEVQVIAQLVEQDLLSTCEDNECLIEKL